MSRLNRFSAFGIHLGISAVVAVIVLGLVFFVWYPFPLAEAVGVLSIVLLLLGIDVILGPFLTLLVYKPEKPSLKMDLTIIVCVQVIALVYGMWSILHARPAWIVFNANGFDLIQAHELDPRMEGKTEDEYKKVSWFGPKYVAAKLPVTSVNSMQSTLEALASGYDIANQPWQYEELKAQKKKIMEKLKSTSELNQYNDEADLKKVLPESEKIQCWLPLMAKIKPMVVLMDCDKGSVIQVVNLRPWN